MISRATSVPSSAEHDLRRHPPVPGLDHGRQELGEVDPVRVGAAEEGVRSVEDEPVPSSGDALNPMQQARDMGIRIAS
jgi:hypothetical protein